MAYELVAGANALIPGDEVAIRARATNCGTVDFAVAVLPIPGGAEPWLPLQDPPPSYAEGATSGVEFALKLSRFGDAVQTVALVLYSSAASSTLMPLRDVSIDVGDNNIRLQHADLTVPSIVFAELYRRKGQWKVRAKKDGVFDGIEELGRRLGVHVTDRRREEPARHSPPPDFGSGPSRGGRGNLADWTGSGSMVADRFLITNAHVVNNASEISVSGFSGKTRAEPVIVDETNDLALLRLSESFGPSRIVFRDAGVHLGEHAHAIGYPLAGLLGRGPQFTSGSVSNLLGPGDDARLMQITCPIQPGSSGGPVFDESGNLVAVVTASLNNAQNVNFAIRSALVLPLLDAANIDFERKEQCQPIPISEIVRANSPFVWRVECFG
ncbi:trypsin-like peptidase domain-containing protein [Rhizobium leguminosarum]|uniref:trypsin-like peptidase domain-containing protein n=1 Tax=Rhizobium leguminosarum TaxID=384 RepID=UPI0004ADFF80|nr:trypsin-like peptidase domain-containing protein [Rhizobium leguminosarum]WFT86860.1 trypsin-like peptidase domain-containing protein [Rhizobium leguminosarum]